MQTVEPTFWDKLKEMLVSKKFIALVAGLISTVLVTFGVEINEENIVQLITLILGMSGMVSSYIVGQGLADQGKEAAKIQAVSIYEEQQAEFAREDARQLRMD